MTLKVCEEEQKTTRGPSSLRGYLLLVASHGQCVARAQLAAWLQLQARHGLRHQLRPTTVAVLIVLGFIWFVLLHIFLTSITTVVHYDDWHHSGISIDTVCAIKFLSRALYIHCTGLNAVHRTDYYHANCWWPNNQRSSPPQKEPSLATCSYKNNDKTATASKQQASSTQAARKQQASSTQAARKQHASSTQAARKQHASSTQAVSKQ
jgi:hypothetical protein